MSEDTKNINDWDARLMQQYERGWDNYIRRRINLDAARDMDCLDICGEFFYVEERSSAAAVGSVRLNRNTNDEIDLDLGTTIKTVFAKVFITHAALQGEWIDIIYGINFEYYKEQPVTVGAPVGGALAALQLADGHNVTIGAFPLPAGASTAAAQLADGHNVTVDNAGAGAAVNIQDGGNAITIDAAALPLPAGASTAAAQLADGHNVTVDNAGGGAAVNIQDGGNTITVDAAALPLPAGAATAALQLADGHNVTNDNAAGAAAVNIQDGGNSITVDGEVTVDEGEAQAAIMITNVAADANSVGAANACSRVLIRALTTNTGLVWVDFNNAAVENACYPLDTGDAISVPLSNTNLINCLFKVANEDVAVIFTA